MLVTSICRGPGPVATRMPFFSPKFKSTANFLAPAQEGNLFFLSGRSARKKIHNFHTKSGHLCRTSRHVWLLSSACDHDGCQGGNDTSTKLLHCEKSSACIRRVRANCHNAKRNKAQKTVKRQTDTKTQWNRYAGKTFLFISFKKK